MSHIRRANRTTHCANGTVCRKEDKGFLPEGLDLDGDIEISDTAEILGQLQAKDGCQLRDGTVFADRVSLGAGVFVDEDSIVREGSMIGDGSKLGKFCDIDQGVTIGKNVEIGDGVHIKLGAQVDDDTSIGTRSGGTTIGECSWIKANSNIQGSLHARDKHDIPYGIDLVKPGMVLPRASTVDADKGKLWSSASYAPKPANA